MAKNASKGLLLGFILRFFTHSRIWVYTRSLLRRGENNQNVKRNTRQTTFITSTTVKWPQSSTQAFSSRSLDSTWWEMSHSVTSWSRNFSPSRVSEQRMPGYQAEAALIWSVFGCREKIWRSLGTYWLLKYACLFFSLQSCRVVRTPLQFFLLRQDMRA